MTDRLFALTVLLDQDIREDDAGAIVNAILMIKHVQKVEPHISDICNWAAEERIKKELGQKLWEILYPH